LNFENRYKKKNGNYIWISWQAFQRGDYIYANITPHIGENDELLSRIAHELKTPLNSILGFSELLLYSPDLTNNDKEILTDIMKGSSNLENMINNLLDMSKINLQNLKINEHNLNTLIKNAVISFTPDIYKKNINLYFHQKNSHNIVYVDKYSFERVLKNFISNAIKYNKPYGEIYITCLINDLNGKLQMCIEDTGIGITEKNIKNLYIPFNRLGITSEYQGNGIGLAYSKKILDLFNISIECTSKINEFTKFTFEFNTFKKLSDKNNNDDDDDDDSVLIISKK